MRSKSMTSCADKMLIWISKDVHTMLKIDAAKTGSTIGTLADLAIRSYYQMITRKEEEREEQK